MSGEFDPSSTVYITTLNAMDDIVQALRAAYATIVGPVGDPGDDGDPGPKGFRSRDGNTVLHGTGAPADTLGGVDDFYVDLTTKTLYGPKKAAWGVGRNIFTGSVGLLFFQDLFGGTDPLESHATDSGDSWVDAPGFGGGAITALETAGGLLQCEDGAGSQNQGVAMAVATVPSADYAVRADNCTVGFGTGVPGIILVARYDDGAGDGYAFEIQRFDGSGTLRVFLYQWAGAFDAGDTTIPTLADGFDARIEVEGTAIRAYINDALVLSGADASLSAAGTALVHLQTSNSGLSAESTVGAIEMAAL